MQLRFKTLAEWLRWQETLHPKAIDLGLERVREVYQRLGITSLARQVVTIAGTNGKGSCVSFLEHLYSASGHRVASYTSPHILRYNERIRLLGETVSDELLMQAFSVVDRARGEQTLSYFEFGTLAAFYLFSQLDLDIVLLEVGLGGRLDAANIIDADVSLITAIGLDHHAWLGNTRNEIAREKAGILRCGKPAIVGDRSPPDSIFQEAERSGALLSCIGKGFDYQLFESNWRWKNQQLVYSELPLPTVHNQAQLDNVASALQAAVQLRGALPFELTALKKALLNYALSGRCQCVADEPEVWLDVAHNEQAITTLIDSLAQAKTKPTYIVLGILADKDKQKIVEVLASLRCHWYLAAPKCERALSCEELRATVVSLGPKQDFSCHESVNAAFEQAVKEAGKSGRVVVTGSFFTVAEVMAEHYSKCL